MDIATMRARVREDLQDTDAANYRWSNDEVDGAIERTVRERVQEPRTSSTSPLVKSSSS